MLKIILLLLLGKNKFPADKLFKMIKGYLIVYILILPGFSTAQEFGWIKDKPLDYQYNPSMLNYLVANNQDAVYWIGLSEYHEGYNLNAFGKTFIEKYNVEGNLIQSSVIDGSVSCVDAVCDPGGDLYMLLLLRGTATFESGDSLPFSGSGTKSVVLKMNGLSGYEWVKEFNGYREGRCLALDNEGHLLVGNDDFNVSLITIYDPQGNLMDEIEQLNVPLISSVDVDIEDNIYAAGSCAHMDASFNGSVFETDLIYNKYVVKYNPLHQAEWVKYVNDITCSFPEVTCHDPDYIYFAGELSVETQFDSITLAGPEWVYDYFAARLNAGGDFVWAREVENGQITGDASLGERNYCHTDAQNNLILSGFTRGTIDWGNGFITSTTGYGSDVLLLKLSSSGNIIYALNGGSSSLDRSSSGGLDASGNYFLTGFGSDTLIFGNQTSSQEGFHPFLVKLENDDPVAVDNTTQGILNVEVRPNPFTDLVRVKFSDNSHTIRCRIIDPNGVLIVSNNNIDLQEVSFDLSFLPKGIYILEAEFDGYGKSYQKMIKR